MKDRWDFAAGDDTFAAILRRVNVEVPGRADGRTKEHTERYSMARLLAGVADELTFPFTLVHHDRPDFILVLSEGRVGIEHTEVIPENVARASFLREKGHGPSTYFLPRAELGESRKTADELKAEIARDEPSGGWYGDSPERETAAALVWFAQAKCLAARKPGFQLFEKNWLLMYNNWPAPAAKPTMVAAFAAEQMGSSDVFQTFSRVFVLCSRNLLDLSESGVRVTQLVDPGVES